MDIPSFRDTGSCHTADTSSMVIPFPHVTDTEQHLQFSWQLYLTAWQTGTNIRLMC